MRGIDGVADLSLVADDVLLPFEGLGAGVAGELPLVVVDVLLVDLQVAAVGESLHADVAAVDDVGSHSVVRTDMKGKHKLCGGSIKAQKKLFFILPDMLQVTPLVMEGALALVALELSFGGFF